MGGQGRCGGKQWVGQWVGMRGGRGGGARGSGGDDASHNWKRPTFVRPVNENMPAPAAHSREGGRGESEGAAACARAGARAGQQALAGGRHWQAARTNLMHDVVPVAWRPHCTRKHNTGRAGLARRWTPRPHTSRPPGDAHDSPPPPRAPLTLQQRCVQLLAHGDDAISHASKLNLPARHELGVTHDHCHDRSAMAGRAGEGGRGKRVGVWGGRQREKCGGRAHGRGALPACPSHPSPLEGKAAQVASTEATGTHQQAHTHTTTPDHTIALSLGYQVHGADDGFELGLKVRTHTRTQAHTETHTGSLTWSTWHG